MKYITNAILVFSLSAAMVLSACSTTWLTTFDNILVAAAPALINILQIVAIAEGKPVNTALATKINGDAAALKQIASDFYSASATAAPGVCSQLQAEIGVYSQDEQQVLAIAQVSNPTVQTKIAVLSGLVATTVTSILAVIPNCKQAQAMTATLAKTAPPLTVSGFVSSYNTELVIPTGNAKIDTFTVNHKLPVRHLWKKIITLGIKN